jgi:broad specificity phosphatase PhoE
MQKMKEIYIVRHGQTEYNALRIIQGSGIDSDLNDIGRAQAKAFFEQYKDVPFEVALTSKLKRTHQTVAAFVEKGLSWEQHIEINEMGWGVHEGKKGTPQLHEDYKKMVEAWKSGQYDYRLEAAESAAELAARLTSFVENLKIRPEKTILTCSHGRAMRCLMSVLKEEELSEMEKYSHSNTGLYKVIFDGKFHFELENDTSHYDLMPDVF